MAPSCTVEYARSRSTRPSTVPVCASTTPNVSGVVERRPNCAGRVVAAGPDVAALRQLELGQERGAFERLVAERLPVGVVDGRFECGRADVAVEDTRVRVVEDRRLDLRLEQHLGLAHEVLVERVLACDQHGEAVSAPARASPLLAERGDGSGKADRDGAVEQADVDPELERVGRRDAEQLALDEAPLDLASLCGRVAGAVRREPLARVRVDAVDSELVDQLRRPPALGEADRAQPARDERCHQP